MNSDPLRVIVSAPLVSDSPTGPGVHLTQLTRAMLSRRPDLSVVYRHSTSRGPRANRESAARVDPRIVARTAPVPATVLRRLEARLRFPPERLFVGPYDLYHQMHTDDDPAVPSSKLIVTLHDTVALRWPEEEGRMSRYAASVLGRASAVITVSQFSKAEICRAFAVPPHKVHVVYNGVDHARFSVQAADHDGRERLRAELGLTGRYLLFAGGHTPRKNLTRIVQALAVLRQDTRFHDLDLVLIGPVAHARADVVRSASNLLPPDRLVFPGYVPDDLLPTLYRNAAALVYPSLYEGFGLPIVEALACGTPVVTSRRGATEEIAGGAAELVDPLDPQSIAVGLETVLSDTADRRAARVTAGITQAARFSWADAADQLLSIYDDVLAGARP